MFRKDFINLKKKEEGISMPQMQLPIFPSGTTMINTNLAIKEEDGLVTYFYGHLPVFTHHVDDTKTFRMITSQICANGNAKQADIHRTFGVPLISIKRGVKLFNEKGTGGFYEKQRTRGGAVLTDGLLARVQELLDEGRELSEVAAELSVQKDTLRKATKDGRLHAPKKKF